MPESAMLLVAALGVLFIGLAKAGFGGALGMLTTPLCVVAFSAQGKSPAYALGVILPLLCAGDLFSLFYYWRKWDVRNLRVLLPGAVVGIAIGSLLIGHFSARQLNICIGAIALGFVLFQLVRDRVRVVEGRLQPTWLAGLPFGFGAGLTSTFAHGAGPVVAIFLIAQKLPKEVFIGTNVLVFTWINWIKIPFFIGNGIITPETARTALWFLPLIPVGVWAGVWLNRRMSEALFLKIAYILLALAGLYLLLDPQPTRWFGSAP